MSGNGDVILGAELFRASGWLDAALLEDLQPVGDSGKPALGESTAGLNGLSPVAHEQMHRFAEQFHVCYPVGFALIADEADHRRVNLWARPENGRFEDSHRSRIAGGCQEDAQDSVMF